MSMGFNLKSAQSRFVRAKGRYEIPIAPLCPYFVTKKTMDSLMIIGKHVGRLSVCKTGLQKIAMRFEVLGHVHIGCTKE